MSIFETIILGIVQGLTEFIPVSSSGHLEIVRFLLNINPDNFHYFLEFINLGTLIALLVYFRKRILEIIKDVFLRKNFRLAVNILITSIPAGLIGLLLGDFIAENPFFGSIFTVCVAMAIVGVIMCFIDRLPHLSPIKSIDKLTPGRALAIGLVQTFALIPGTSRSATTILTGRIVGFDSESAAEYSFLASIPIMCGVCLKMFISPKSLAYLASNFDTLIIGNIIAFISGFLAIKFLLNYLKKPHALRAFGVYRIIVACLVAGITLILI